MLEIKIFFFFLFQKHAKALRVSFIEEKPQQGQLLQFFTLMLFPCSLLMPKSTLMLWPDISVKVLGSAYIQTIHQNLPQNTRFVFNDQQGGKCPI